MTLFGTVILLTISCTRFVAVVLWSPCLMWLFVWHSSVGSACVSMLLLLFAGCWPDDDVIVVS